MFSRKSLIIYMLIKSKFGSLKIHSGFWINEKFLSAVPTNMYIFVQHIYLLEAFSIIYIVHPFILAPSIV